MATSAGLANLLPIVMTLVGIVSIVRSRRLGRDRAGPEQEERQVSAAEVERRMASYLAGRHTDGEEETQMDQLDRASKQ
jgi:hypothetical protein